MAVQEKFLTVEEFEEFVLRPENREQRFEYIGGRIAEVVSNNYASKIAVSIASEIHAFIKGKGLGYLTGADGGYKVSGENYMPDVGFISSSRQPEACHVAWNPLAPDLAVEVLSPTDSEKDMLVKIGNYLAARTTVWLVSPIEQTVLVFAPDQPVQRFEQDGSLTFEPLLPGFRLAVRDIFAD